MNISRHELKKSYSFKEFLTWLLFFLIPVLTAIHSVSRSSAAWTFIYILVLVVCFAGIEYRFFCTHCPHYKNTGRSTKCMFLWNFPAFFSPRPGPLGIHERAAAALGFIIAIAFPVFWLLKTPLLLLVYLISWGLLVVFLRKCECSRCINRSCPLNSAPADEMAAEASPEDTEA